MIELAMSAIALGLVAVVIGVIDDWLDGVNEWQ